MTPGSIIINKKISEDTYTGAQFPLYDVIPCEYLFGVTGIQIEPHAFEWDFGDGTSSEGREVLHEFQTYGYHKVVGKVLDGDGNWLEFGETGQHVVLGKIDFIANPVRGDKPLTVEFENKSITPTGCIFSDWVWEYGDTYGATGMQGQIHNYMDYGSYNVELKARFGKLEEGV